MRAYILRTQKQVDRLVLLLRSTWKDQLEAGRPLEVEVSEFKKRRSEAANRRYWAILEQISRQVFIEVLVGDKVERRRYPKEHWHEYFKRKFIGYVELPDGQGMLGLSTTALEAPQFLDYVYKVEVWAVEEHGVVFKREE